MNAQTLKLDGGAVLYDAELFSRVELRPDLQWFRAGYWERQGLVASRQRGRGTALVIKTPVGRAVLRQFLRGGWAARFIRSRYLFTGYHRSRAFREFHILARLASLGLPVPRPLAGLCERHGLSCSGALITLEIEDCRPLEQVLDCMDAEAWRRVGRCIGDFHGHGLVHADLTVRNILIQEGGAVYLVDFDRARFSEGDRRAFERNLQRFKRSLRKTSIETGFKINEMAWTHLLQGYES